MTTGEGIAAGTAALLLGGLVYLGATKLSGNSEAEVLAAKAEAAKAQAALQAQQAQSQAQSAAALQAQQALAREQQASNAARPNVGGVILGVLPSVINIGTKLFGGK